MEDINSILLRGQTEQYILKLLGRRRTHLVGCVLYAVEGQPLSAAVEEIHQNGHGGIETFEKG